MSGKIHPNEGVKDKPPIPTQIILYLTYSYMKTYTMLRKKNNSKIEVESVSRGL